MSRVLSDNVWVDGVLYRVGDAPPPEVACQIGDHAWTQTPDVEAPSAAGVVSGEDAPVQGSLPPAVAPEAAGGGEPAGDEAPDVAPEGPAPADADVSAVEPPRVGRGSSKAAWLDYAAALGVAVDDGMSRDDIVAAVDARA